MIKQTSVVYPAVLKMLQLILIGALILYFGRTLFVPMSYGLLIALILYPLCRRLEILRWPRTLAITGCLLIVFLLFVGLVWLLGIQLQMFRKDLPDLLIKLDPTLNQLRSWLHVNFGLSLASQDAWWQGALQSLNNSSGNLVGSMLSATASGIMTLFLVPVYAALFLYNRHSFVYFLEKVVGRRYNYQLREVLSEVIHTYSRFIKGMVFVYLIVGVLNSVGLLALGIRHAVLFGMLTAIMTIIPYVGIMISALLPISIAWITKESIWYPVGVVAVFAFVQYLEANVIFPKVVATQLKVSTWATLVAIFAGGIVWGVSGMILFIPFVAIFKVVAEKIPGLRPLTILLNR